jgi:hypothetical protein
MSQGALISGALSDPVFSGLGTWLGTGVSIISAWVAYKQAVKAASIASRLHKEQRRGYVAVAQHNLVRLDEVIKPIVMSGIPARGVKVSEVVVGARKICHELLSSPVHKILQGAPESIKNIEGNLAQIEQLVIEVKTNSTAVLPLRDLQQSTLMEMQILLCSCATFLDSDATVDS